MYVYAIHHMHVVFILVQRPGEGIRHSRTRITDGWVLRTELGFSTKATSALGLWGILFVITV